MSEMVARKENAKVKFFAPSDREQAETAENLMMMIMIAAPVRHWETLPHIEG